MILGGRLWCTLSIHRPGRSVRAARFSGRSAIPSRSGPSGWPRRQTPGSPGHRRPGASPDRGTADRHYSHPLSRLGVQTPIGAASQPAAVLAAAHIGERVGAGLGQADRVVRLAIAQQQQSKSSLSASRSASPAGSAISVSINRIQGIESYTKVGDRARKITVSSGECGL